MTDGPHDRAIIRAVGAELRRIRDDHGWSRPELVARLTTPIPVNTYACWEQGIRACSLPWLVEICSVLGVDAPDVLKRALDSLELTRWVSVRKQALDALIDYADQMTCGDEAAREFADHVAALGDQP